MPDIFLSYSREDHATARRFVEGLERAGYSVWWDAALSAGEEFDQAIEKALTEAKAVVVLWSKNSVSSRWVRAEATQAHDNGTLVPVMIEPCKRPIIFELIHTADLSRWNGDPTDKAWQSYLAGIRRLLDRSEPNPGAVPVTTASRRGLRFGAQSAAAVVAVLVVIAGAAVWTLTRRQTEHAATPSAAVLPAAPSASSGATTSTAPRTSIAVMPFVNLTGDASKDYLGDGMAEEVINTLAQVPGLKVPARTSSFAYKGRNTDIRQICRDLGVGTILEGSVRTAGKRIRIAAEMIDAQDGLHIWSHTYDEQFSDLFKLQDDLANAIVQRLQVSLNSAAPPTVTRAPPTQDVGAYNLYLQGYALMGRSTEQALDLAFDLFAQALARDPRFARAYAARSDARLVSLLLGFPRAHALEDAEHDAERALALNPNLGDAHEAVALISVFRANWLKSETGFGAALAADPNNPGFHSDHALILSAIGRLHQALSEAEEGYRLAPADPGSAIAIAFASGQLAVDSDAVKYADLAVALGMSPSTVPLPQIYASVALRAGRFGEAADRSMLNLAGPIRSAGGADVTRMVYAALGDPTKKPAARQALQRLVDRLGMRNIDVRSRRGFVLYFTLLDVLEPAYELANLNLEEFLSTGSGGGPAWAFLWLPEMRAFRQDPRFQRLVTRLNLVDYWKQYGSPDNCDLKDGNLVCH